MEEIYDLDADPYEERNLAGDPGIEGVREELREELGRLTLEAMGLGGRS